MNTLTTVLLAIIAYILWRIYRQCENETKNAAIEKFKAKREQEEKGLVAKYPHLVNKLEGNWLEIFARHAEIGTPLLKLAFLLYLHESTKIDYSPGSFKWDSFWNLSEELLEHLEKFHEGSTVEHEIAIVTYWQAAAEAMGKLIEESPNKEMRAGRATSPIEGENLEVAPYTNINKIVLLFPQKANHPDKEISLLDEKGVFPRESKGSAHIHEKMKALGL